MVIQINFLYKKLDTFLQNKLKYLYSSFTHEQGAFGSQQILSKIKSRFVYFKLCWVVNEENLVTSIFYGIQTIIIILHVFYKISVQNN